MVKIITIRSESDIRITINAIRILANSLYFSKVDMQKLIVAVSELTQNIIDHAESNGTITFENIGDKGIKIIVQDRGKGIKDLDRILNGFTNFQKKGLGMGLLGARRLMDDFNIKTSEEGTTVIAIKWKS